MAKKVRGGAREGSGRKPVEDKKIPLTLYIRQSAIDKLGSDNAKEIGIKAIDKAAKK